MSKGRELRKLLTELEKLPEETREGAVTFLELVLAMERALREASSQAGDLQPEGQSPARHWASVEDMGDLLRLLDKSLRGQRPGRRDLILSVLVSCGRAYEVGEDASGRLLLQQAIIMTAGQEHAASAAIQDVVCSAARAIAKTQGH